MNTPAAALWEKLITAHRMSQVYRTTLSDRGSHQVYKDDATKGLVAQERQILEILDQMSEQLLLVHVLSVLRQRGI